MYVFLLIFCWAYQLGLLVIHVCYLYIQDHLVPNSVEPYVEPSVASSSTSTSTSFSQDGFNGSKNVRSLLFI